MPGVLTAVACHLPAVLLPLRTASYYYPPATLSPDNCQWMPSIGLLPLANCLLFPLRIGHMPGLPSCHPSYLLTSAWFAAWTRQQEPFCPSDCLLPADFLRCSPHLLCAWGHLPAACSTCPRAVWFRPLKCTDGISPASLWLSNGEVGCKWLCRINGKEEKQQQQSKMKQKKANTQIVIKNTEYFS